LNKRKAWEQRMFGDIYDKPLLDSERPKYGNLNITYDPSGTKGASHYGNSFLILSRSVRHRVTITNGDSSRKDSVVGTLSSCCHVLHPLPDPVLKWLLAFVCRGDFKSGSSQDLEKLRYVEAQIHGTLRLDRDVEAVFVSDTDLKEIPLDVLIQFTTKYPTIKCLVQNDEFLVEFTQIQEDSKFLMKKLNF